MMNKLNKILIIPIILSIFSLNISFAESEDAECNYVTALPYSQDWDKNSSFDIVNNIRENDKNENTKFLTIDQQKAIITKDDLNTALLNLKKYCCDNGIWNSATANTCSNTEGAAFNKNVPDSQYLFDHIFDVIMRKLSWLTWENDIYTNSKMTWDVKWVERRSFISEQAENLSWANPETIMTKYHEYWTGSDISLWFDINKSIEVLMKPGITINDYLKYVSWQWNTEESKKIAEALKQYEDWTLLDRYNNACALTTYFYVLLTNKSINIKTCKKIVEDQIDLEKDYVNLIIKKSSNLFLANYINWYISYLYDRENKLKKLRKDSTDRFLDVVKAVPGMAKHCRK